MRTDAGRPWEGENTSLKIELAHTSNYWPRTATFSMERHGYVIEYSEAEVKGYLDINEE